MQTKPCASIVDASLHFIPVRTRVPLKFGRETTTAVTCARVRVVLRGDDGKQAEGWGETPLSASWLWPSELSHADRDEAMRGFCRMVRREFPSFSREGGGGHPMEIGHAFMQRRLPSFLAGFNRGRAHARPMPWLAALGCFSPFDLALHDAYAVWRGVPVYDIYSEEYMGRDLAAFYSPEYAGVFSGTYPADFLVRNPSAVLPAWHLVGGADALTEAEAPDDAPDDGLPVSLTGWIRRDGLRCLKVKLRGDDAGWDCERLVRVGEIALKSGGEWLSADFNCGVGEPAYVCRILDWLADRHPGIWGMILYVEQPFPYDLEKHRIDVHSVSERKPLFMDESAHGWEQVALGRELGWTGVALKTCKTQTGALLSLCWARAHGMGIMVQDLTNPMLAQISHLLLAAHAGTIMGVESNSMQFYPGASLPEAAVHPGMFVRRDGCLDVGSVGPTGFGYRVAEMERRLPPSEGQ